MRISKKKLLVIITVFFLFQVVGASARAQALVAVFPFKINGEKDLDYVKNGILEILCSRIGVPGKIYVIEKSKLNQAIKKEKNKTIDTESMQSIGYHVDADYLVGGTLSQQDSSLRIEGEVKILRSNSPPVKFSIECKELNEVIGKVAELAGELRGMIIKFEEESAGNNSVFLDEPGTSLQEERILPGEPAGENFF